MQLANIPASLETDAARGYSVASHRQRVWQNLKKDKESWGEQSGLLLEQYFPVKLLIIWLCSFL